MIEERIALVEEIFDARRGDFNADYLGYKNHVYRMINFCFALGELGEEDRKKVIIAGCFHDMGIWTANTFDYLPPSIELANTYLRQNGLDPWIPEMEEMIGQHHRLRKHPDRLTELFRKGDLVDFSLGLVKCGVSGTYIKDVKSRFPNSGFHRSLVRLAGGWICRHPLNPLPVVKW